MLKTTIRPRFSDTDALGHINNTVIPVWFLEAREPVLQIFMPGGAISQSSLAVVRMEVDYLKETHFGEDVTLTTIVHHIGNSSFALRQEVWQCGHCTARGITTLVHFNPQSRSSTPLPEHLRAALEDLMEDEGNRQTEKS